ncbi:MAG: TetR/AcrR family transcriptional regulator [Comamonas sp.]
MMEASVKDSKEKPSWKTASSRNERSVLIREELFRAASEVVGQVGYQDASVAMITQRAGVAQGTFYNHFSSRQDLFDKLLPSLGGELLNEVKAASKGASGLLQKEEAGFRAFFSFLKSNPHFFRILNEAELFAPEAYRIHLDLVQKGYMRMFRKAHEEGEIAGFDEKEFEAIAYVLMSSRTYLAWRYVYGQDADGELPEWVVKGYMRLLQDGLRGKAAQAS